MTIITMGTTFLIRDNDHELIYEINAPVFDEWQAECIDGPEVMLGDTRLFPTDIVLVNGVNLTTASRHAVAARKLGGTK